MGVYLYSILPRDYQEVERIKATWSQYINTWFAPKNTSKIKIKFSDALYWSWDHTLFGADKWWKNSWFLFYYWQYGSERGQMSFGTMWGYWGTWSTGADGNLHTMELSQDGQYVDGTLYYTFSTMSFTSSELCLFCLNRSWTKREYSNTAKIYNCKLWDNWTLVRDLVPCYRKSDSVIWMYDLVNDVFYTNQWTWIFTKWANVDGSYEHELKNAYIGGYYEYSYDFRNKSTSQITADGWTYDNAPSFNSDGMYYNNWPSRNTKILNYNISSAKKITLKANFKITWSTYALGVVLIKVSDVTYNTGMYIDGSPVQQVQISGSVVTQYWTSKSSWTYTETMEFDFENKTYTFSGLFASSWSLTDSQISWIKNTDWLRVNIWRQYMFCSGVGLTINY